MTATEDQPAPRPLFWKLAGFYAAYFLAIGIYVPYWPLWLDGKGLDPVRIGWVLAGAFWIKIVAQPVIARFADRDGRTRWLTTALMALAALGFLGLSGVDGFWPVLILAALTAACYQPVLPVMESVVLRHTETSRLDYGRIRLWGSVTFIIGTAGVGWWLEGRPANAVVWLMVAGMTLVSLSCAIAPNRPRQTPHHAGALPALRDLISPSVVLFLLTAGLIQASHSILYGFASLYWRQVGHGETTIGLFWAVGVAAEIGLFAVAGRYRDRLSPVVLLALAALGGAVRWPLLAVFSDTASILALQTLHGLTFGAGHLGAMGFLSRTIPAELSATGQSLYYALIGGVLAGCMLPLAGMLYATMAGGAFFVMGGLSAAALLSAVLLSRIWRG